MRKLTYIFIVIILALWCFQSCTPAQDKHIYHTFWGDIDIDTAKVLTDSAIKANNIIVAGDGKAPYYLVMAVGNETIPYRGGYEVHYGPTEFYYSPESNTYHKLINYSGGTYKQCLMTYTKGTDKEFWYFR